MSITDLAVVLKEQPDPTSYGEPAHRATISYGEWSATEPNQSQEATGHVELHLLLVDRVVGVGVFLAGWISDPLNRVGRVTIDPPSGDAVDLGLSASTLDTPDRHHVFLTPRVVPMAFGFAVFIADTVEDVELTATVLFRNGAAFRWTLRQTGDMGVLHGLLARAPLSFGLAFVAQALSRFGHRWPLSPQIEHILAQVYDRIDRQHEYGVGSGRLKIECFIDAAIRVGTKGILVKGWLLKDDADSILDMRIVSLSGRHVPVAMPLSLIARPDVLAARSSAIASQEIYCGFVTYLPIPDLAPGDQRWFVEIVMKGGSIRRIPFICGPELVPRNGLEQVVMMAEPNALDLSHLFRTALAPPLEWFWAQGRRERPVATEIVYGQPPRSPEVSIVVGVYGRIDLVRHQIANFCNDPEFRSAAGLVELIYVLDDPRADKEFRQLCRSIYEIYRVPFRTILLNGNFGYSSANNAGARVARGRKLLLLNSDVIPKNKQWVGRFVRLYDSLDQCGVLGCRLLFEDGSIQHGGIVFRRSTVVAGAWDNDHRGKGLSTAFDPHTAATAVQAVTGACLLIDRSLFMDIGLMSEDYLIGDFEDSDLCLKIHEQGLKVYYTPEIELYHLERQSMALIGNGHHGWRQSLTLFNMWKHAERWKSLIPIVSARYEGLADGRNAADAPRLVTEPITLPSARRLVHRTPGGIAPGFLSAISPAPFKARLNALFDEDPAARVLSWTLQLDERLEWAHTIGVSNDPALRSTVPDIPPTELRSITAAVEEPVFLWSGLHDVRTFLDLFDQHATCDRGPKVQVLDFGCGCGRLTRFLDQHGGIAAFGADINPDLADWCRQVLRNTQVEQNGAAPPLPFVDASFDLVFSMSVFTHLAPPQARQWLAELARTLVPGGLLVVTTHGYPALEIIRASPIHQSMFRVDATETQDLIDRLPREKFIFIPYQADILSAAKAGEEYGNSFIEPDHIRTHWSDQGLTFVTHVPGGVRGWQDVVVLRRT